METSAILGRIKSVHKSHPSIMELFMRELKQIAIVCVAIVAAVFAWADIPNVFDLDLDAPREEAPTVVPTRPPDDPEPVDEPYEPPSLPGVASLPGYESSTNRLAAALYVLSCTNSWSEQNAYFIGVTNAIKNALNNP